MIRFIVSTWSLALLALLGGLQAPPAFAQNVVFDGTLGTAGALQSGPSFVPGYQSRYTLRPNQGVTRDKNLFHSLSRFNLGSNEEAFFASGPNINNIFVRVTGREASNLQGLISTSSLPTSVVNLFIINPSGITLGPNARINATDPAAQARKGAFVATTVDGILFPNGVFSAVNPLGAASLLNLVGDPSGFLATQRPGNLVIETQNRVSTQLNGLVVPGGQPLLLLGGDVLFRNSTLRTVGEAGQDLQTTGISLQVASVAGVGVVGWQNNRLNLPADLRRGNVTLQNSTIYLGARTGGDLQVDAQTLSLTDSNLVLAAAGGVPNARGGDVQLRIADRLMLDRSIIANEVPEQGRAQGGNLIISAPQILGRNSQIRADSFGLGNAGDLTITAAQAIELSGDYTNPNTPTDIGPGGLFSQINQTGIGNGGNLRITTPLLRLRDGSKVQTATFGIGRAGTITITARDVQVLETAASNYFPTSINAGVTPTLLPNLDALGLPKGDAGGLIIQNADQVIVDGGSITVANFGEGKAGDLQIFARDRIQVDNGGDISTTTRSGQGGNLFLTANNLLLLRHGGQLNATAGTPESSGNGGNIQLNAPFVIAVPVENSDIIANAFKGRGGNITITTEQLLGLQFRDQLTPDSDITASSDIGLNGTFTLNTPDLDPNRGLVQLPTTPTDPSNRIDQSCASSSSVTRSRFTATGRGGLPSQPDEFLSPSETLPRLAILPPVSIHQVTQTGPIGSTVLTPPIIEARAALRLPNGKIRFVAQVGHSVPDAFGQAIVGCQSRQPE